MIDLCCCDINIDRRLCEDKMSLINLDEWGKKKHPPRIGESISEFTALGKVRNNIMFACDVLIV